MRAAALLVLVGVALAAADQTPPRTAAPTAPAPGGPGAINTPPATTPATTAPAQDPMTAVIRGRVIRADNGQPIQGARVHINGTVLAVSDADGRFEATKLRAGNYVLTTSAMGFPAVGFGSRGLGDPGRSITVTPGQIVNGIDFTIPRGAVLSGVVLDERGDPLPGAAVWVLRQQFVDGERRLVRSTEPNYFGTNGGGDVTDDLGRFRIFGLNAGTYYLAGTQPSRSSNGANDTDLSTFDLSAPALYPTGGPIAEARALTIAAGQELSGLSFAVRPVRTATITVLLATQDGPVEGELTYWQVGGALYSPRTLAGGRYTFAERSPGTHMFFARNGDHVAFARVELSGEDVTVPLTMKPGGSVRGRVVTDDESATGLPSNVRISGRLLQPGRDVNTPAQPDGSFELRGLVGPMHLTASAPGGWVTKQLLVGGTDVTGSSLDTSRRVNDVQLVLTQKAVGLSGLVRDDTGKVAADAFVVIFADDADRRWPGSPYVRAARAGADGRFTLRGVPAGRYRAVAVAFLESGQESDPDLVAQLESASTPVTLSNGITATLELRLTPWP